MLGRGRVLARVCWRERNTQWHATYPNGAGREEGARIIRGSHAESGGNGVENNVNDDERTGTRAFVAGERGAGERGADADQRDANKCHADEQETEVLPEAIAQRR